MQGDEAIAVPATPPVAPLRPALAGRRPSSSRRGRLAAFMSDVRAEAAHFRRLFRYSRPYRVMLVASWIATAGYAAAGAGIVNMVQPIFDDVLIQNVRVGAVALTLLGLYAIKGLCSFLSTTMVAATPAGPNWVTLARALATSLNAPSCRANAVRLMRARALA